MIFQHTFDRVLDGTKTQTRRLVKPGHVGSFANGSYLAVYGMQGRPPIYEVGQTAAVQSNRGIKALARIRITGIRLEDVREISEEDAKAEGFCDIRNFWYIWTLINDKLITARHSFSLSGADYLKGVIAQRPAERYQAWVLEFERVEKQS